MTLSPEIIKLLDSKVDGVQIRNRSHAVEYFLQQYFHQELDQAVIFANKSCMSQVRGKPVLQIQIEYLMKAGFQKILVCDFGGRDDEMADLLKRIHLTGSLEFFNTQGQSTADALRQCKKRLSSKRFLTLYGDVLTYFDLADFVDFHRSRGGAATVAVTSVLDPTAWGVVRMKRDKITHFEEKPKVVDRLTHLINAGIAVYEFSIFKVLGSRGQLSDYVLPILAEKGELYGYLLDDVWLNVRDEKMLEMAEKESRFFFSQD